MRTLKKTLVILITAAMLFQMTGTITAFAEEGAGCDGDFDWMEADTGVTITAYTGVGGSVTIPTTLSGKTVTDIDAAAFKNGDEEDAPVKHADDITDITILAPITVIAAETFSGCTSLESVTLGSNITEIGEKAFYGTKLTSIRIPASVETIGVDAFNSCSELTTVTFDTGTAANPGKLNEIGNGAFYGTKLASVRIPSTVTTIGDDAFSNCAYLTSLTFAPECAAAIGNKAFYGTKLVNITIPESIGSIGAEAFANCPTLAKVVINNGEVGIGTGAFEFTDSLIIYAPEVSSAHTFCTEADPDIHFTPLETTVGNTSITSVVSSGTNRLTITWTEAERATEYELWRSSTLDGTYARIATVPETSYTNTGIASNATYYYKVKGINRIDETHSYEGNFSDVYTAAPMPGTPNSAYAVSAGYSSIRLYWTPVAGASGYEIHRAYDKIDNPYSLVKTLPKSSTVMSILSVKPNSNLFTGLSSGRRYYYKVRAYVNATVPGTTTTKKCYGAFSGITMGRAVPAAVTNLKATQVSPTSIKLTWKSVAGRTRYQIWRKGPNDDEFVLYPYTAYYTYFTNDRGILVDKEFSYKVRAYRSSSAYGDNGKVYGAFSNEVKITPIVKQVTGVVAKRYSNTRINITWSSLKGADGYQLQWAESADAPDEEWTTVDRKTYRYYYHTGRTDGTTYYYRIRAYEKVKVLEGDYPEEDYPGGKAYGDWSLVKYART